MARRSILAALAAFVALAAAPAAAQAAPGDFAPSVNLFGLTGSGLSADASKYAGQGYSLTSVSGYVSGGSLRYAALWRQVGGPVQREQHGLDVAGMQAADQANRADGFRLAYVTGYEVGGVDLYAAVWEQASGAPRQNFFGLTAAQLQSTYDSLTASAYRLVSLDGYTLSGSARYAAIFEQSSGPPQAARSGLTLAQLQQTNQTLASQGYRLQSVSGLNAGAGDRYAAIWEQGGGPLMQVRFGTALADYGRTSDIDQYHGYLPAYTSAFTSGSSAKFNSIRVNRFTQADLDQIKGAMDAVLAKQHIAGASVAIAKDDRLLYAGGFGLADKENNVPMDVDHRLRVGSISKSITSTAIYKLLEEGRLSSLDRTVFGSGGVLGSVAVPASMSELKQASVKNFLLQNDGLPGDELANRLPLATHCASGDLSQRIQYALAQHVQDSTNTGLPVLLGAPGQYFDYSNFNYVVLGRAIEALSGTGYESYLRTHVFGPAGVDDAHVFKVGPYDPASGEAKHYLANGSYAEYPASGTCDNVGPYGGAGNWAMSAKDLLQWFDSVDSNTARNVLSPSDQADMITANPPTVGPNHYYAKGWITQGWGWCGSSVPIVQGHNGSVAGAYANLFALPNGFSFAIITNQQTGTGTCHSPSGERSCGGASQPRCDDDPVATLVDLLGKVNWPDQDLFPGPGAPETTLTGQPPSRGADATPTFTFSSSTAGAGFQCSLDDGAFTSCGSPFTAPHLADGAHTFSVRAIVGVGNADPTPATDSFVIDTTPPKFSIFPLVVSVRKRGVARVRMGCEWNELSGPCTGRLSLKTVKKVRVARHRRKRVAMGSTRFSTTPGRHPPVKLRVPRKGRSILKGLHKLRVKATVKGSDAVGNSARATRTIKLRG